MSRFIVRFVVTVGLLAGVLGCESQVQHGLDEKQANEIQAALSGHGIDSSKVGEGGRKPTWAVAVPSRRAAEAVQVLADLGLPRTRPEGMHEVYGKGGLVPSASEERALYMSALSGELSQTLESFEGVLSARVHLVLPVPSRPGTSSTTAKASVFLKVRPEAKARLQLAREDIRALVAGSVEGLSAQEVTLVVAEATARRIEPAPAQPEPHLDAMGMAAPLCLISGAGALVFGVTRRRWLPMGKTGGGART